MLVVFAAARLLSEIFERLGQPGIVGEILAGVLIGPHVLGWMHPGETLNTLSELGVMFLLFRVGLEVKSSELLSVGGTALTVAVAGVLRPSSSAAASRCLASAAGGIHVHRCRDGRDQRRHYGEGAVFERPAGRARQPHYPAARP